MIFFSRRLFRYIRYVFLTVILFLVIDILLSVRITKPSPRVSSSAEALKDIHSIYITSTQWNSANLLQEHWIPSLLQVVKGLQAANIRLYVSIYENGSWDSTRSLLQQLKRDLDALDVENTVVLDEKSHEFIIAQNESSSGFLHTAYGTEMRRIPYLATVRNEALKPLRGLTEAGRKFDRLIYINDVIFSPTDIYTLLMTNSGTYAAACALDFRNPPFNHIPLKDQGHHPPGIYDDFATRDFDGNILASHLYPYFASVTSKKAVMAGQDVPVQTCWNGLVAFDVAPFQQREKPLSFRAIPDSLAQYHVEASECCVVHYDNPFSQTKGVFINPAVRVAYSTEAYRAIASSPTKAESNWPTGYELQWGYWKSKWTWWWARDWASAIKVWSRVGRWRRKHPGVKEPALNCVSDLAMVLTGNGWAMRGGRFE